MSGTPTLLSISEVVAAIDKSVAGDRDPGLGYAWSGDGWHLTLSPHGDSPQMVLKTSTRRDVHPLWTQKGKVIEASLYARLVQVNAVLSQVRSARFAGIEPREARDSNGNPVLAYGPCCLSPELCTCRRYGVRIRALGYHPIASTMRRDLVCLSLDRNPGSLVPVTNGDGFVEMWDPIVPWDGDFNGLRCVRRISVSHWAQISDVARDSQYRFQPDSEPSEYDLRMGEMKARLLDPSIVHSGSPQSIAAAAIFAGAVATRIDLTSLAAITVTAVVPPDLDWSKVTNAVFNASPVTVAVRVIVVVAGETVANMEIRP